MENAHCSLLLVGVSAFTFWYILSILPAISRCSMPLHWSSQYSSLALSVSLLNSLFSFLYILFPSSALCFFHFRLSSIFLSMESVIYGFFAGLLRPCSMFSSALSSTTFFKVFHLVNFAEFDALQSGSNTYRYSIESLAKSHRPNPGKKISSESHWWCQIRATRTFNRWACESSGWHQLPTIHATIYSCFWVHLDGLHFPLDQEWKRIQIRTISFFWQLARRPLQNPGQNCSTGFCFMWFIGVKNTFRSEKVYCR